jgi:hypothetical protein
MASYKVFNESVEPTDFMVDYLPSAAKDVSTMDCIKIIDSKTLSCKIKRLRSQKIPLK